MRQFKVSLIIETDSPHVDADKVNDLVADAVAAQIDALVESITREEDVDAVSDWGREFTLVSHSVITEEKP